MDIQLYRCTKPSAVHDILGEHGYLHHQFRLPRI